MNERGREDELTSPDDETVSEDHDDTGEESNDEVDAPAEPVDDPAAELMEIVNRFQSGANWYFWIAALSLVNSVMILSGSEWSFVIGLGVTQVIDFKALDVAKEVPEAVTVISAVAFGIDLFIAGIVALFGVFARKGHSWAFLVGIILYGMDGLLFARFGDWMSVGFHVFAMYGIWSGWKALGEMHQLQSTPHPPEDDENVESVTEFDG